MPDYSSKVYPDRKPIDAQTPGPSFMDTLKTVAPIDVYAHPMGMIQALTHSDSPKSNAEFGSEAYGDTAASASGPGMPKNMRGKSANRQARNQNSDQLVTTQRDQDLSNDNVKKSGQAIQALGGLKGGVDLLRRAGQGLVKKQATSEAESIAQNAVVSGRQAVRKQMEKRIQDLENNPRYNYIPPDNHVRF